MAVSTECARVLEVNASSVWRYEGDDTATVVAGFNRDGIDPFPLGTRLYVDADHADRAHPRDRPALAGRRLGHGRGRVQGADAADRLPLDGGGADHRRRHALGSGHDQQRRPAAGERRGAPRRVLRPRLARGRERAGTRGPADVALPDRPRRRRAAPAARAQPARRRPAAARRGDAAPARGAGEARGGPGDRGQAAPGRRPASSTPGSRSCASSHAGSIPARSPSTACAGRSSRSQERLPLPVEVTVTGRAARPARRGDRVLHRLRGAEQRRQARARLHGDA